MKGEFAKEGEKQYVVNFYHNDEKPSLKCEMSKTDEGLKMVVRDAKPNGDVKLHAIARVVNDRTAEIAVWHTENSQKVTDARFSVLLSKSQLIRANLFIRPEVNREIMKNSLITVKTVKDPTKNQFFRDTLLSIYKANREMNKDIVENMQTLTKGWIAEQRVFMKDFGAEYESLVDLAEENFEMAREIILVSYDTVYQKIEELVEAIPQTEFRDVLRSVKNSFNDVPQYINQVVEPFKKVAAKISEEIENGQKGLAEVFNYLDENMKLKELRSAINEFINKVVETDFIRVAITHARDFSKEYSLREVNTALGDVENNLGQYKSKIEKVWNEIKDQLIDYAAIFGVSSAVEAILEPAGNFEVERRITELVHFLRGKLTSKDLSEKIWNKWLPRITKKDLKKAEIEVEIPIPVRSNTLREVVDQVHPERLVAIKNDIVQKISAISLTPEQQNLGYAVLDTIHMYKPLSLNIYDVIPPFGSKAYLIGDSHFITFDGRVYEHNSACEMLLAADLVDSEFSVIGKFGKSGLESIKVEYKNRKIVLSRDGKITVNGNAETLPWQWLDDLSGVSRIKITQTDDHVHLHTYDGLHVQCQLNAQLCEVEVPGRMHGRSAGLLGSNDNEPNNDWDHVDGTKNKNDLKTMSSNNAVEGTCSPATPVKPAAEDEGCAAFFNTTDSPLRLCFAVVLPSPFYSMCAVERAKGRSCDVVSAYVAACHTVGVDIDLPQKCVKCDGIPENKDKDVEKMTGQDIVFVVEEAPCLTDYGKKISEFVSSLAKGSEKFGWVGFGGFGAHNHPHLQSSPSASVVFDAAGIQAVAKEDHYSVPEDSLLEMPAKSDPMRAVEFAINHYPFRLGAGKTVVLITCQKCAYNELGQHELLEQLLDLGVRLHHVTTEKVRGTEKMKAAGITAETVFDKAGADLGDRSTIRSPNDVCAVVAQETKGTVLNLKHGYTLASKLEKPTTDCQKCHCEVKGIHTKTVCHPCEVVEPVSVNSRTFSGIADFGSPAVEMDEDPDKRIRY
ncbi:hypothetical protein L596_006544 [Steinernema carpocapsae]|uniref:VWFD domain-containing protein n=1 Tax=Steinernema carpocapsae TaxID=34508 RepID=A0A4V6I8V0_STECR|nr:hypothetical protein L596_006544 [Steinernema carpocapsae]